MRLRFQSGLTFVTAEVVSKTRRLQLPNVVLDTGSASTLFAAERMKEIGIEPALYDTVYTVRGIGGTEPVFTRTLDQIRVGQLSIKTFAIEISGMQYGRDLDGILGLDFLIATHAVIDLDRMEIRPKRQRK